MSSHRGQVVCFETFRRERQTARVLPYLAPAWRERAHSPFGHSILTGREAEHRERMLRHLSGQSAEEMART